MSSGGEFGVFLDDERRRTILRGVFDSYYAGVHGGQVVFDTNRSWTARVPLLSNLFPDSRIICCVRDVGWILDSIERVLRQNPLQLSKVFKFELGGTVYSRSELLMNSETGLIGLAWAALREAWFGENARRLIILSYDRMVRDPHATLRLLYTELNEPFFEHDFDNVSYDEPDYDLEIGMPGLHKVRPKVEIQKREPCIPPDILSKYSGANFWANSSLNRGAVTVI